MDDSPATRSGASVAPSTRRAIIGARLMKVALWCLGTFAALVLGLFAYHMIRCAIESRRFPAPGQMIDIGGRRLHIWSQGQGEPVVVLDAPMGGSSLGWALVQPGIAAFTRVISYDRAGYAWSDTGPGPRTASRDVEDLRAALRRAGVKGNLILVGSSSGGLAVRLFAMGHRDEVVGVILLDTTHEDSLERVPGLEEEIEGEMRTVQVARVLAHLGVLRLLGVPIGEGSSRLLPESLVPAARAAGFRARWADAIYQEISAIKESLGQVKAMAARSSEPPLGDLPLTVVVHGKAEDSTPQREKIGMEFQEDLAKSSTRGRLIIAQKSGHFIQADEPELVVDVVREMIHQARQATAAAGVPGTPEAN